MYEKITIFRDIFIKIVHSKFIGFVEIKVASIVY